MLFEKSIYFKFNIRTVCRFLRLRRRKKAVVVDGLLINIVKKRNSWNAFVGITNEFIIADTFLNRGSIFVGCIMFTKRSMLLPKSDSISDQVVFAVSTSPSGLMPLRIKFFNSSCPSNAEPRAFRISNIVYASSSEDAVISTYSRLSVMAVRKLSRT